MPEQDNNQHDKDWYWRCTGEWVFNSRTRAHVHQCDPQVKKWVAVWGEPARCPINENGEDDIGAITEELRAQDEKRRKDMQATLKEQEIEAVRGAPTYDRRALQEYADYRAKLPKKFNEHNVVRTEPPR